MSEKKKIIRNSQKPVQLYRFISQAFFAVMCVWIGIEFYFFAKYLESGGSISFSSRPAGAEGFLPISSMMSLYYFILTGEIHSAHPAGLFIFIAIIAMSFVFGKSFCSWVCPVGFISEMVGDFSEKLFKRKMILPRFLDYPLRGLKYLLLAFFIYSIFFLMSDSALKAFLDSDYNLISDVKMYYFFANISRFSLIVISSLFILSIFIRNFWCRFLCPYGALLGIFSLLSPHKIKRNKVSCIDCGLCAKACPSFIKVDKVTTVTSDECSTCLSCVDACPVADTLELKLLAVKKTFNKKYAAVLIVLIFVLITGAAKLSGRWQNNITKEEYRELFKNMQNIGHPTGVSAVKEYDERARQKADANNREMKNAK